MMKTWILHQLKIFPVAKVKRILFGKQDGKGLIVKLFTYAIMIGIGYMFLYPILNMIAVSLMSIDDLVNPEVIWLPSSLHLMNYQMVLQVFQLRNTLFDSIFIAGSSTIVIVLSSCLIGFGLARYDFPLKRVVFVFILVMFALPPQILSIPRYVMYNQYGLIGSIFAFLVPAFLGQGINQAIFILIFYQFFRTIPKVLTEAAQIEGAGHFQVFSKIYVPLGGPAVLTTTIYSFIWYWNSGALTAFYMGRSYTTVMMRLNELRNMLEQEFQVDKVTGFSPLNEGVLFAGNIVALLPLLLLYILLQKWFVESVDRSGITGE